MENLHQCLDDKKYNKLQLLIELGHDPNIPDRKKRPLLHKVIKRIKNNEIKQRLLQSLLTSGIDTETIHSALEIAVQHADLETCNLLLNQGIGQEVRYNALLLALERNDLDTAKLFLSHGQYPDILKYNSAFRAYKSKENTPKYPHDIFWVAKWLNLTWLYVCLQNEARVNFLDDNGETFLFHALHSYDSVFLLLKSGINVNTRNLKGETALTHAKKHFHGRHPNLVQLLIEHGAIE